MNLSDLENKTIKQVVKTNTDILSIIRITFTDGSFVVIQSRDLIDIYHIIEK